MAILLFGAKLPDVARTWGKHYRDFRRTLNEMQDEFRKAEREVRQSFDAPVKKLNNTIEELESDEPKEPAVPKFTPPPAKADDPG